MRQGARLDPLSRGSSLIIEDGSQRASDGHFRITEDASAVLLDVQRDAVKLMLHSVHL